MLFNLTMILPIFVALFYHDGELKHFAISLVFIFVAGLILHSTGSTFLSLSVLSVAAVDLQRATLK